MSVFLGPSDAHCAELIVPDAASLIIGRREIEGEPSLKFRWGRSPSENGGDRDRQAGTPDDEPQVPIRLEVNSTHWVLSYPRGSVLVQLVGTFPLRPNVGEEIVAFLNDANLENPPKSTFLHQTRDAATALGRLAANFIALAKSVEGSFVPLIESTVSPPARASRPPCSSDIIFAPRETMSDEDVSAMTCLSGADSADNFGLKSS